MLDLSHVLQLLTPTPEAGRPGPARRSGGGRIYGGGSKAYGGPKTERTKTFTRYRTTFVSRLLHAVGVSASPLIPFLTTVSVRRPSAEGLAADHRQAVEADRRREVRHRRRAVRELLEQAG